MLKLFGLGFLCYLLCINPLFASGGYAPNLFIHGLISLPAIFVLLKMALTSYGLNPKNAKEKVLFSLPTAIFIVPFVFAPSATGGYFPLYCKLLGMGNFALNDVVFWWSIYMVFNVGLLLVPSKKMRENHP